MPVKTVSIVNCVQAQLDAIALRLAGVHGLRKWNKQFREMQRFTMGR